MSSMQQFVICPPCEREFTLSAYDLHYKELHQGRVYLQYAAGMKFIERNSDGYFYCPLCNYKHHNPDAIEEH